MTGAIGATEPPSPQAETSAAMAKVQKMGATGPLYYDVSIPEVVNAIRARLTTLKNGYDSVMAHFFYQVEHWRWPCTQHVPGTQNKK